LRDNLLFGLVGLIILPWFRGFGHDILMFFVTTKRAKFIVTDALHRSGRGWRMQGEPTLRALPTL